MRLSVRCRRWTRRTLTSISPPSTSPRTIRLRFRECRELRRAPAESLEDAPLFPPGRVLRLFEAILQRMELCAIPAGRVWSGGGPPQGAGGEDTRPAVR